MLGSSTRSERVVQRAPVHAGVEDDLADRRRAEEVGGGEVGNVDEIRAGVGGCAAEDDDGERATGHAEVVSLAVEDEYWGRPERGSPLWHFIAKNRGRGLAVGDPHPGI